MEESLEDMILNFYTGTEPIEDLVARIESRFGREAFMLTGEQIEQMYKFAFGNVSQCSLSIEDSKIPYALLRHGYIFHGAEIEYAGRLLYSPEEPNRVPLRLGESK